MTNQERADMRRRESIVQFVDLHHGRMEHDGERQQRALAQLERLGYRITLIKPQLAWADNVPISETA